MEHRWWKRAAPLENGGSNLLPHMQENEMWKKTTIQPR